MTDLLFEQPLLLLFLVLALGYALGRVALAGVRLGVAAVLFVGLALGALDARLALPELFVRFGLVLFVYALGIGSGPAAWTSLRRSGGRELLWTVALLAGAALVARGAQQALGLPAALTAGLFCGALTNTPALAALLERAPAAGQEAVVGYSIAYPMGALGIVVAITLARRLWRGELATSGAARELDVRFLQVSRADAAGRTPDALLRESGARARLVRRRRAGAWSLVHPHEALEAGDLVTAVGLPAALDTLEARLGGRSLEQATLAESDLEHRRMFVSDPSVAGRPLAGLRTLSRFGALITRVRRGDLDFVPDGRTVLELGDRVRVVAPRAQLAAMGRFLGDSVRALSEIDAVSFGLGAALGLLLGLLPIPLPWGGVARLGPAGGPLVMGLVLGALGRTGPVVWQLPYSASLTLRQLGLAVFLAGVGLRAGAPFAATLFAPGGLGLLAAGAAVTLATASLALLTARALPHTSAAAALGMAAGVHTQPAALAVAEAGGDDGSPGVGYAGVSPVATVAKILLAQLLLGTPQG